MRTIKQLVVLSGLITIISCGGKNESNTAVESAQKKVEPVKISNAWRSFNVSTLKITSNGVGKFEIGRNLPAQFAPLKHEVKNIVKKTAKGTETVKTDFITSEGKILFGVDKDKKGNLNEINIYTPEITTKSNIGVGNTIAQFVSAYPDVKVWYTHINDHVVLESPSLENIQFIVDKSGYKDTSISYNSDQELLNISDFNTNTKIESVRVF